jgi:hypothetical protein
MLLNIVGFAGFVPLLNVSGTTLPIDINLDKSELEVSIEVLKRFNGF